MKNKLIKLQDRYILVSDEESKVNDWVTDGSRVGQINVLTVDDPNKHLHKKIIAGITELPSIDFSLLSEKDCKTIGFVDVEKLANDIIDSKLKDSIKLFDIKYLKIVNYVDEAKEDLNKTIHQCLVNMFKTAQSLSDNMFSSEDMRKAYSRGFNNRDFESVEDLSWADFIQSLQQTSWDVEVNELNQITKIL